MVLNEMIFDPTFSQLEVSLRETARRQAVIAHNVANASTEGFRALSFSEVLNQAEGRLMQPSTTAAGQLIPPGAGEMAAAGEIGAAETAASQPLTAGTVQTSGIAGGAAPASEVVLEEQMAQMAENNLRYTSYVRLLNYKIALLRKVISQGRQ